MTHYDQHSRDDGNDDVDDELNNDISSPTSQHYHYASSTKSTLSSVQKIKPTDDETTPLLSRPTSTPQIGSVSEIHLPPSPSLPPKTPTSLPHTRHVVPICMLIFILLQAANQLLEAPLARIFESIYCYRYWELHDPGMVMKGRGDVGPGALGGVQEQWCKVDEVQASVAELEGALGFYLGLPSLLLAIPFGILADRWGRKPIIVLGLSSFPISTAWIVVVCWFWQIFDIRLVWLSALHGIMGGSATMIGALLYTVLCDVTPEDSRAPVFFQMSSCGLAMGFLVPPLAAWLMAWTPWIPIFAGQILLIIPILLMAFVPETIHHHRASYAAEENVEPQIARPVKAKHTRATRWLTPLKEVRGLLLNDWRVFALAGTFILHAYTRTGVTLLLVQYVSTRFRVTFSKATLLIAVRAGFTVGLYLVLLPWISSFLVKRYGYSGKKKDLVLMRASSVVTGAGWFMVALAPDMSLFISAVFILTFGAAFPTLVQSFLSSLVSPCDVAKLYTVLSVLETLGLMGGSPFFAWLFKVGLGIGGPGVGLPFLCLGALYVVCAGLACCIRIKKHDRGEGVEEDTAGP